MRKLLSLVVLLSLLTGVISCDSSSSDEEEVKDNKASSNVAASPVSLAVTKSEIELGDTLVVKIKRLAGAPEIDSVKVEFEDNPRVGYKVVRDKILVYSGAGQVGDHRLKATFHLADNSTVVKSVRYETFSGFDPEKITLEVVNKYPHDNRAYTQGLQIDKGTLYEGTGMKGRSSVRKVALESGTVILKNELPSHLFGEGICIVRDTLYQLTWKGRMGYTYNASTLTKIAEWAYPIDVEGWGLTSDGKSLVMSVGTEMIYFLNPRTFEVERELAAYNNFGAVSYLNELEWINGEIYANVYQSNSIVVIDPLTGAVKREIDCGQLLTSNEARYADVLNGIAFDKKSGKYYITGKDWPWLFEVKM